jgi:hypothetical protein
LNIGIDVRVVDHRRYLELCRSHIYRLIEKTYSEWNYRSENQRQYVWVNLAIDMMPVENSYYVDFAPIAAIIKRLDFKRYNDEENGS